MFFFFHIEKGCNGKESNLHNISVNHVLSWQQPVLYLLQRQDGAKFKLAEMILEQREDFWSIFFGHRP